MNQPQGVPTKRVSIPVDFPAELELPVNTETGQCANGFTWQRFLDYATLEALGLRVVWRDQLGVRVDRETALGLIERLRAHAVQADASAPGEGVRS